MKREDDFFVGYLPTSPNVVKRMTRMVTALGISIVAIAATVGIAQHGFAHSRFEFGRYRAFEGVLLERPYPMLLVLRPGNSRGASPFSVYLLVDQFKHGADDRVRGLHGQRVSLEGELIYRAGNSMLELKPGSIRKLKPSDSSATPYVDTLRTTHADRRDRGQQVLPGRDEPRQWQGASRLCGPLHQRGSAGCPGH